jgi:TIR domain-containing protein
MTYLEASGNKNGNNFGELRSDLPARLWVQIRRQSPSLSPSFAVAYKTMRLFISYASEDRNDFAEPLAAKLRENYDVWFAPYELKVGDSLFQKINEGLRSCDYGVVILSHHFFAKKWPPAELNGLYALEEKSGKMILPVWLGLTAEDIKKYSPILADRIAANGSEGIEAVVAALRFAIDSSDRQRVLGTLNPTVEKFKGLAETIQERRESEQLLQSEEGVRLISEAAGRFFDVVEKVLSQIPAPNTLNVRLERTNDQTLQVICSYRLTLHLHLKKPFTNTATNAALQAAIIQDRDISSKEWDLLGQHHFTPSFRRGREVVWKPVGREETLSTEEVARDVLERFLIEFQRVAFSS